MSQNLESLRWEKRVLVIETPSFKTSEAIEQVELLKASLEKCDDYKLSIMQRTNEGTRLDYGEIVSIPVVEKIKNFKITLIGLDGGVKFESKEVKPAQTFFDLINSMPMRQNELRGN